MDELINRVLKAPPLQRWGGLAGVLVLITLAQLLPPRSARRSRCWRARRRSSASSTPSSRKSRRLPRTSTSGAGRWTSCSRSSTRRSPSCPEAADLDELLAQLNEIGRKSGLEISTVEPAPEEPAQIYVKIPIKMALTGNYHEIAMFLQSLANLRRIVNVNNIQLGSPTLEGREGGPQLLLRRHHLPLS